MSEGASTEYYDVVEVHERTFQSYSIQNGIYHVPVDEVSG
jgi:hypothetical protein